ncbi:MAG: DUF2294 domain-containing protein [Firmicutes bacterium]|nr:DUF2294 domain-containing protein [Bacillota bacterium]
MPQRELSNVITDLVIRWGQNYLGQNLAEVKTDIIRDMIIVSVKGEIPPAESHLSREKEGMFLVKKIRQQLIEYDRESLDNILFNLTGSRMVSLHTDVSTKTGERIFVFKMDRALD